ncbi:MAG: hypothetical protein HKN23_06955 [Verrucomicrobiales bacterium]|nr:hypothetical protein [Verrucomicrobiales bacterium]
MKNFTSLDPAAKFGWHVAKLSQIDRMKRSIGLIFFVTGLLASPAFAQEEKKEEESGSLGDLLNKVKDIKVPESVTNLPSQLTDLKESYLETAKTVEELKVEVTKLREEVDALKAENKTLREKGGVTSSSKPQNLDDLLKPIDISTSDLVAAYAEDRGSADKNYGDRYLRVIGPIASMEPGVQSMHIYLRAEGSDQKVKCTLKRDAHLHVEVLAAQGRMISRNDRRTLLTVGQPVAILGTCKGTGLNVEMTNCKIEGLEEKRVEKPASNKN